VAGIPEDGAAALDGFAALGMTTTDSVAGELALR
jgi:hypothetical protein